MYKQSRQLASENIQAIPNVPSFAFSINFLLQFRFFRDPHLLPSSLIYLHTSYHPYSTKVKCLEDTASYLMSINIQITRRMKKYKEHSNHSSLPFLPFIYFPPLFFFSRLSLYFSSQSVQISCLFINVFHNILYQRCLQAWLLTSSLLKYDPLSRWCANFLGFIQSNVGNKFCGSSLELFKQRGKENATHKMR